MSASGLGAYSDRYTNYQAGFIVARKISNDLHFTSGLSFRHISVTSGGFRRFGTRVSAGIAYSPGDLPISFF